MQLGTGRGRMKILWITKAAAFVGGAERHIADVAPLLVPRGASNFLLYDPNVPVDPEFLSIFDGAFPWVDLERQLKDLAPDILYIHQLKGLKAAEEIANSSIPSVRFFHDHAPFCLRGYKYSSYGYRTCSRPLGWYCIFGCLGMINKASGFLPIRIRTLSSARAELDVIKRFDAFAVGSVYMKDHVVSHGFSPASVRVLPMFSPAWRTDGPDSGSGALDAIRKKKTLLFVGALIRGKGLDVLLSAMSSLPSDVRLLVAGSGHQESMFRSQVEELKLADRVEFLGRVKRIELEKHYQTVTSVVVPSREPETFGLVGLEAYRHSTPVVASRVGGTGDWLLEGITGYGFPSGDSKALANAILKIIDDPVVASNMGKSGHELLTTRFTPERHAVALWNLLESTIHRGRLE